jgi:hypothetical protein
MQTNCSHCQAQVEYELGYQGQQFCPGCQYLVPAPSTPKIKLSDKEPAPAVATDKLAWEWVLVAAVALTVVVIFASFFAMHPSKASHDLKDPDIRRRVTAMAADLHFDSKVSSVSVNIDTLLAVEGEHLSAEQNRLLTGVWLNLSTYRLCEQKIETHYDMASRTDLSQDQWESACVEQRKAINNAVDLLIQAARSF